MKFPKLLIACLSILPLICVQGKETEWNTSRDGSTHTLAPELEHIVQDRSVTYFPELPFDIREVDSYNITLEVESTDSEWSEAGIVFGGDEGDFHFFIISSYEQYYTYGSHEARDLNANWKDYMYRVKSDEIEKASNTLRISKRSKGLEFYINGKRIARHDLPDMKGMKVGYYLRGGSSFTVKEVEVEAK